MVWCGGREGGWLAGGAAWGWQVMVVVVIVV